MENKKSKLALSFSALTSFGSLLATGCVTACTVGGAACAPACALPLLSFMGISGTTLATISWLAPLKPYLIALGILSLAYAFWQAYKPQKKVVCADENAQCECPPKANNRNKIMLWVVTLFCLGLYLYPIFANNNSNNTISANQSAINNQPNGSECASNVTCDTTKICNKPCK